MLFRSIYEVSVVTFPAYEETVVITADGTDPNPTPEPEPVLNTDPVPNPDEVAVDELKKQALIKLIELL